MKKIWLCGVVLLLLGACPTMAQDATGIFGRIVDNTTGEDVVGAVVEVQACGERVTTKKLLVLK